MLRHLKRKPETPDAEAEESLRQDNEIHALKRSRSVAVTPGELRLQKDLESLDEQLHHYITIERHEDDNQRIILRYLVDKELQDKIPNNFELTVRRFYPHDRPFIRCLDPGFTCSYILENGDVIHESLTRNWTAVCGLGDIIESVQEVRQIFQMLNDPHRVDSIDAQALQAFMTVPTSPSIYSPNRHNAEQHALRAQQAVSQHLGHYSQEKGKRRRDEDLIAECNPDAHIDKYAHLAHGGHPGAYHDDHRGDNNGNSDDNIYNDGTDPPGGEHVKESSILGYNDPHHDLGLDTGHTSVEGIKESASSSPSRFDGQKSGLSRDGDGGGDGNRGPNRHPNPNLAGRDNGSGNGSNSNSDASGNGHRRVFRGIDTYLHPQETSIARPFISGLHNTMMSREQEQQRAMDGRVGGGGGNVYPHVFPPYLPFPQDSHYNNTFNDENEKEAFTNDSGFQEMYHHQHQQGGGPDGGGAGDWGAYGYYGAYDTNGSHKESDCLTEREGDSDFEMEQHDLQGHSQQYPYSHSCNTGSTSNGSNGSNGSEGKGLWSTRSYGCAHPGQTRTQRSLSEGHLQLQPACLAHAPRMSHPQPQPQHFNGNGDGSSSGNSNSGGSFFRRQTFSPPARQAPGHYPPTLFPSQEQYRSRP